MVEIYQYLLKELNYRIFVFDNILSLHPYTKILQGMLFSTNFYPRKTNRILKTTDIHSKHIIEFLKEYKLNFADFSKL